MPVRKHEVEIQDMENTEKRAGEKSEAEETCQMINHTEIKHSEELIPKRKSRVVAIMRVHILTGAQPTFRESTRGREVVASGTFPRQVEYLAGPDKRGPKAKVPNCLGRAALSLLCRFVEGCKNPE
ncbi:hypothetical protein RUM43_002484 [Polyplax serrata]|uniref:Uncharacterized protein n=1 Tax=Polyplax serrata TaxID=468196 RepID=A0AAN8NYW4_POLSC